MKPLLFFLFFLLVVATQAHSQVDTTFIYNNQEPYGTLDIRLAKSETRYYFLEEDVTFSFRESSPGVKTNTYRDMTSWDSSPYTQGNLREQIGDVSNFVMNYRLLKPIGYDPSYSKGYPLIIMMHGSGETGNCWNSNCFHADQNYDPVVNDPPAPTDSTSELLNNDHSLLHGGSVYLDAVKLAGEKKPDDGTLAARAYSGFVLFPQNLNGWAASSVQDAIRIIRLLTKKYNIDQDRIYIHGLSNGGYGVYEALKRAPWMFASAIAMSAVSDAFITNVGSESEISHIKLWIFQGALDTNPYPQKTRKYIDRFRNAGVEVRYTEYADIGHTVWNKAYREPDFFSWFLGTNRAEIHPFGGNTAICDEQGLLLELADGYFAYQWEKDGTIITGADSATFIATSPGQYRARFSRISTSPSEDQWNEWSEPLTISTAEPPVAEIKQIGTVLLKDLNGNGVASLESATDFAHYYWYKDGTLLDLPGTQDDTLKNISIQPGNCTGACTGNGVYTLVVSGYANCKSDPSEPKYLFFNNQAPVNINAPSEFTGTPSSGSVQLSWKDNANNEGGYEIWRRPKSEQSSNGSWQMATLTIADVHTFVDSGLLPNTIYQYKIRAVSNTGRSNYAPAAANEYLEVNTVSDSSPPSAPQNLTATRKGLDRFLLSWNKSKDDVGVKEYLIEYNGGTLHTTDTTMMLEGLAIDSTYQITSRAVDFGNNSSDASNIVTASTNIVGLFYQHTPGSWSSLDSIDWNQVEYTGFINNFSLRNKTQEDYFNFRFDGFLHIDASGDYKFRISSDDGSRLRIDGNLIADNNDIHDMKSVESETLALSSGAHRITVDFFEFANSDTLVVEYIGADTQNQWTTIPDEALRSNVVIAVEEPLDANFIVEVYPNPGSPQEIMIKVQSRFAGSTKIDMVDAIGNRMFSQEYTNAQLSDAIQLSPELKIANGIYLLRVRQSDRVRSKKVIIKN